MLSDGKFVYVPKGVRCPMELSTYFRINAANTGQFERTLLVADDEAYVSYLEGCTAPMRDENQLHAAIVEIVAEKNAEVKYSTVQNWYPGDKDGKGGIFNFVTKRGKCAGVNSKISWTQVETGSAITWKYPSCILRGDESTGEFYSVAVTRGKQQADTGTKMIHIGRNTRSTIVSKGISAGKAQNTYRGLVSMHPKAKNSRNYTQCDSLLIGDRCAAHTYPYIEVKNNSSRVEHEPTTSKIDDDQIRRKLRQTLAELNPPDDLGFIIRTAGLDRSKRDLQRDLNYLLRLWKSEATESFEGARRTLAAHLGAAEPRELIFTRGTTEAINLVACTFGERQVGAGDEIVQTRIHRALQAAQGAQGLRRV